MSKLRSIRPLSTRPTARLRWRQRATGGLALTAGLLVAAPLVACDEKNPYRDALAITGEVATDRAVVFNDFGRDELRFVLPDDEGGISLRTRPIGDERDVVAWIAPTRDGDELLALNVPADEKQEEVEERLLRFPGGGGGGDPVEYPVLSPFDSLALTPDHRRAVLYFNATGGAPITNANQVAICELANDQVRTLTLNGFGGRLEAVQFPAQLEEGMPSPVLIGEAQRDLVAFLAAGEIVLVDMDDPVADQVSVNFRDGGLTGTPTGTLLRDGNGLVDDPILFVRSNTDADVAALTLIDKPDEETGAPGFTAQIGLIDGGAGITDFVTYDGEQIPYLITVNASGLRFTDIRTYDSFDVSVPGDVSRIFLRDAEKNGQNIKQAVLWRPGGTAVYTLDLDDIESTIGRQPHPLNIQAGIADVVSLDNDRLLVGSNGFLYVVDIPLDQVTPLATQVPYDPRNARLEGNLLLLGAQGSSYVSTVDLRDLNPESMVLDYPTERFYYLPRAGKIVAMHAGEEGLMTVVDGQDPSRSTSRVSWGFFLDGVLDDA